MPIQYIRQFTTRCAGTVSRLETVIRISENFNPDVPIFDFSKPSLSNERVLNAVWDTGATRSVISKEIAETLNLRFAGFTRLGGAHVTRTSRTFLVCIYLPNRVYFDNVRVAEITFPAPSVEHPKQIDVLIGMDIISKGDFSISHSKDGTIFSFQCPPCVEIDFTSRPPYIDKLTPKRKSPCPCGSGKLYKKCHGA